MRASFLSVVYLQRKLLRVYQENKVQSSPRVYSDFSSEEYLKIPAIVDMLPKDAVVFEVTNVRGALSGLYP